MITKKELKKAISLNDVDFLEKSKSSFSIDERLESEDNDTLLLYSLSDPYSDIYKYFLRNNADITLINDEGENVIHAIVFSGDTKRLEYFIHNFSIDIDQKANDGATPLLLAISLEKEDIARSLITLGADVNISDNKGISPLHLSSQLMNLSFVELLFKKGADPTLKTRNGNLALALAVNASNIEVVKYLFNKTYG